MNSTFYLQLKCKNYEELTQRMNGILDFGVKNHNNVHMENVTISDYKVFLHNNEVVAMLTIVN